MFESLEKLKVFIYLATPYSQNIPVQSITPHPSYTSSRNTDDIAIIRTSRIINFNLGVGPVCLPTTNDQFDNQIVEAIGWGSTFYGGPTSNVLKKVSLRAIPYNECRSYYNDVTYSQLCTLTARADACQVIYRIFNYFLGLMLIINILIFSMILVVH